MSKVKNNIELTECPRDVMQGIHTFIPTSDKAEYINSLLKVGYDVLDFGSFVSPKAIPQLSDTAEVLSKLDLSETKTKLLAIIGNSRGANDAAKFDEIDYLGFPFSISDTFLRLNINSNIDKAFNNCKNFLELCDKVNKKLVIYISMGFGNPYNDPWSVDLVEDWVEKLYSIGAYEIKLSDTIGVSTENSITTLFDRVINKFPAINFGFHLHSRYENWYKKLDAAYKGGCRSYDGVLTGLGGCPMSGYELVGNLQMKDLISYFDEKKIELKIDRKAFDEAFSIAMRVLNVT